MEVVSPAQNNSGFPCPALHGPSHQSRQAEVDGQVNQCHEEGIMEDLRKKQTGSLRMRTLDRPVSQDFLSI